MLKKEFLFVCVNIAVLEASGLKCDEVNISLIVLLVFLFQY